MSSRVGDPVPRRPQGALASQHGHTQLPGPQGGPQQVNPAMAASECTPTRPANGPGVLSLCFPGHGSGVGVREAAGLAGSQGLLPGRAQ